MEKASKCTSEIKKQKNKEQPDLKKANAEFLGRVPWQWFVTLRFRTDYISAESAKSVIQRWLRELGKGAHIQIGCAWLINHYPYSHVHLLVPRPKSSDVFSGNLSSYAVQKLIFKLQYKVSKFFYLHHIVCPRFENLYSRTASYAVVT